MLELINPYIAPALHLQGKYMSSTQNLEARAEAAAEKARAKAMRPWYKKKRYIIPLALIALAVLGSALGGDGPTGSRSTTSDVVNEKPQPQAAEQRLYPDRPDYNKGDVERAVGQSGEVSSYEVTLVQAGFQRKLNDFMDSGYLVADVKIVNRADKAQSYNPFDWKLITPAGQIIDPTFGAEPALHTGDLTTGGNVTGKITWETAGQKGNFYVIYDPPTFTQGRVIWRVTI